MSLTEAENVFAGVHEAGLNDLLTAVFTTRPRLLNYRTSPAVANVPSAASSWTAVPPIAFPGTAGIHYAVRFGIPVVDIHPDTTGMPHPLVLGVGQVSVRTTVELILLCQRGRKDDPDQRPIGTPIATRLEAVALGRMVPVAVTPGTGSVVIDVQQVELVDITPDDLESVLECLVLTLLRAVFGSVSLPFSALRVGAFSLTLLRGPEAEDDQLKLYGAAV
ncbi:hypothetical protein [Frankia sp. Cas4]|uniref:hypothetical protein n=1 Tax=Frankia sp. Cas4 TaxID=3073927 RepID=UPI002AD34F12|nr:hypothetical protein [Frankia sp. Cas4]